MTTRGRGHHRVDPFQLTDREKRILTLLAEGATREEVCADLGVKPVSLTCKLRLIKDKLLVDSVDQAVARWKRGR